MSVPSGQIRVVSELPVAGDDGFLHLGRVLGDSTATTPDGEEVRLGPGDLVFCDPDRPRSLRFAEECTMTVLRLPRRHLALSQEDLDRVTGMTVRGGEGVGALVSDLLIVLATEAEAHGTRMIGQLTRSAADLLVVLVMEMLQDEAEQDVPTAQSPGSELLDRIKAYIDRHLTDPELSPQSVARAHRISVRYLHKLFQQEGTTPGQWVKRRRLDRCKQELTRTPNRRTTVAAVAHRWGFSSPAHFSRTFKDAYGMSPSQWQALASP
ncbi:helix-turn-helix domain-containing protein [Streptomyces antimicrobicus]|uniref:Helix-turn-helix domain-containing protein n=1 Tax=Streptomyces antimicrobicus TaxID=2883108 RepID=A0ABS8B494_9ACTN|nr:helix-turn-helix domain-containing protein [Streptomyces antimicrobicus]MCB5179402.1 helix-turn-helix domain-containing protein [Streptomyces antimicrobicus]